jgi:hypothetical protein
MTGARNWRRYEPSTGVHAPGQATSQALVKKAYQVHLSVTCYLDVEVWAADESDARLAAHNMACPGGPAVASPKISESKACLCTRCAGNGFQLGADWNVDTVEESERLNRLFIRAITCRQDGAEAPGSVVFMAPFW